MTKLRFGFALEARGGFALGAPILASASGRAEALGRGFRSGIGSGFRSILIVPPVAGNGFRVGPVSGRALRTLLGPVGSALRILSIVVGWPEGPGEGEAIDWRRGVGKAGAGDALGAEGAFAPGPGEALWPGDALSVEDLCRISAGLGADLAILASCCGGTFNFMIFLGRSTRMDDASGA